MDKTIDKEMVQTSKDKEGQKKLIIMIIRSLWIISFLVGVAWSITTEESLAKTKLSISLNNNVNENVSSNIANDVNNNQIEDTTVNKTTETYAYPNLAGKVIVVDAGHGGKDPGTQGARTGILECDISLDIANRLAAELKNNNVNVIMTRTDSSTLELGTSKKLTFEERKTIIQNANPDMVISVHENFFEDNSTIRGAGILIRRTEDRALAEQFQDSINKELGTSRKYIQGKYKILKYVEKPGFIIECGFLSNSEDERLLQTQDYQDKIVQLLLENLNTYWNQD